MAVFKCKMCGGALDVSDGLSVVTCEYCGTKQTVPKSRDEIVSNLFNRANNLRLKCEFDKAEQVYEKILDIDNADAEAHWGIVLCKYGIEYVEDPKTYARIPTCHRTLYEAVLTDVDYLAAIENADTEQKKLYIAEAKVIDNLQKDILNIVNNEEPFDVFICYKETDENGKRTIDSAITNDIYYQLTQEGFKVFYAPITLEDKLGHEYEPYIFAALNSAKVMLVVGTKPEYFDSVWVRNEWSRFFKSMKNDRSKLLIPCYRDMDVYELPDEFAHLQAQDMGKIGFISDIIRGLRKVFSRDEQMQTVGVKKKTKKPSKIKKTIEKIKMKRRERARYCLKLPFRNLCIPFLIVHLFLSVFFACYDPEIILDMDVHLSTAFVVFGSIIPLLAIIRFIKNKGVAILFQGVILALSIPALLSDMDSWHVEIYFEALIAILFALIWFVLICFSKKTERAEIKKLNKLKVFLPSVAVGLSLCMLLGLGGLNFCDYHLSKVFYSCGKYGEAHRFFNSLGDYKDSKELAKASIYNKAVDYAESSGLYDEAIEILDELEGYKDSIEKVHNYELQMLENAQVGDYVYFGAYEQDNITSNGKEYIKWEVLEIKDGKVLVISKYGLDRKPYNTSDTAVTWETCTLRKWLNNDFISSAFSAEEKTMIPTITVSADKNSKYNTNPGKATKDKVFLFSVNEAEKYFDFFDGIHPYGSKCKSTPYALNGDYCTWWLRSPGMYQNKAAYLPAFNGSPSSYYPNKDGRYVDIYDTVRPAMWIDISVIK